MTIPQDFDLKAELKKCKTAEDLTGKMVFYKVIQFLPNKVGMECLCLLVSFQTKFQRRLNNCWHMCHGYFGSLLPILNLLPRAFLNHAGT